MSPSPEETPFSKSMKNFFNDAKTESPKNVHKIVNEIVYHWKSIILVVITIVLGCTILTYLIVKVVKYCVGIGKL